MMDWSGHDMGSTGWLLMGVTMVLVWGAAVAVLVAVLRGPGSAIRHDVPADPLRLLNERFARGELDEEGYLRGRELVTGTNPTAPPPSR